MVSHQNLRSVLDLRHQSSNLEYVEGVRRSVICFISTCSGAFFVPVEPVYAHSWPEAICIQSLHSSIVVLFAPPWEGH